MSWGQISQVKCMTKSKKWTTDEERWQGILERNIEADGHYVYGVRTTGVYCSPSRATRLPKKDNVVFFDSPAEAEKQGYRASKRFCQGQPELEKMYLTKIEEACRYIEKNEGSLKLSEVAEYVGMSSFHFHRLFKSIIGLTPKDYASAKIHEKLRDNLVRSGSVTEAIYSAGYSSNSRFYENSSAMLGMTPKAWREGGKGAEIYFALGLCSLGHILVAQSEKGICAILLGDDADQLLRDFEDRFPQAHLVGGNAEFEKVVAQVVGFIEAPQMTLALPLDIRGTSFQQRVWKALCEIPVGETVSYTDIANRIGSPKAVRAVAGACAANMLAVAIPCHRVVKNDGSLSGYRWGVERKRDLLEREGKHSE